MAVGTKPYQTRPTGRLNLYLESEMVEVIQRFAEEKNVSVGAAARRLLGEALALRGLWKVEGAA